jgi:thymidylate synthase
VTIKDYYQKNNEGNMTNENWEEDMYLDLLHTTINNGEHRNKERTGVGTISRFMSSMNFDLRKGFPLLTTKKVNFKGVASELLWFIEGSDDERRLAEIHYGSPREELIGKSTIWTANADNQGKSLGYENTDLVKKLGPIYGVQWRNWNGVDQLAGLIDGIKKNPQSRRHMLSAWNVSDLDKMALPPCHTFCQFYVSNDGELSCSLYQRSGDLFLGVPFNIASYSLLTHMIAQVCDLKVGEFVHTIGDGHVYENHMDAVNLQLSRIPMKFPTLWIDPSVKNIEDFTLDHFRIDGYDPHPFIKADMAV